MKTSIAVLACGALLAFSPAALADPLDPTGAVGTVGQGIAKELGGGITAHSYNCDENNPAVQKIVNDVKYALKYIYPDITTMLARGYFPYPDAALFGSSAREGHWLNPNFLHDGHIMDPTRPEAILVDRWNRPTGVMFIADSPTTPGPDLYVDPNTGVPCNGWHYHGEILATGYWYAYKYGWSGDTQQAVTTGDTGKLQPPSRTPDLMHVWAYGADGVAPDGTKLFQYQFQHNTPPAQYMPGDPDLTNVGTDRCLVGGFDPPTMPPC